MKNDSQSPREVSWILRSLFVTLTLINCTRVCLFTPPSMHTYQSKKNILTGCQSLSSGCPPPSLFPLSHVWHPPQPPLSATPAFVAACRRGAKSDIALIDKAKYLVPSDLTVGQFIFVVREHFRTNPCFVSTRLTSATPYPPPPSQIRKRLSLPPETALFLFVGATMPLTNSLVRHGTKHYLHPNPRLARLTPSLHVL